MNKPTPAPWIANDQHSGLTPWRVECGLTDNDGWIIAHLYGSDAKANAHLIAAAPEIYEALNDLFKAEYDDEPLTPEIGQKCLAALKKARGEPS